MKVLTLSGLVPMLLTQFTAYLNAMQFDEGCFIEEPAALQVAFVIDRTHTFTDGGTRSFFMQFANFAPTLMEEIDKDYPGTQFAVTIHADWNIEALPEYGTRNAHRNKEGCYTTLINFTTNRTIFQGRLMTVEGLANGERENGLSALAFTAADKKIGWIRNSTSADGKKVRRVLILVTDEEQGRPLNNPGSRHEFKGDGTDTCSTSKQPDTKILREVFQKYQMSVISILAVTSARRTVEAHYRDQFKKIGSSIPYCGRRFGTKSISRGIDFTDLEREIPVNFWSPQELKNVGMDTSSSVESITEDMTQREAVLAEIKATAKAGQYNQLIRLVKVCLRETEGCLFGDPEGFNTLGF